MLKHLLPINLQLFAEGEPDGLTPPAAPPVKNDPPADPPKPQGKTFSEDYVISLREEAKNNRLAKKAYEVKLKTLIGLKDDEDIDDDKIMAFKVNQDKAIATALEKANSRLLSAEIKSLDGYDHKLVEKILDRSKVTIAEDGNVEGLKEAVEALATEFPAVKIPPKGGGGANPPPAGVKTAQDEYDEAVKQAYANPRDESLKRKVFILGERLRGE